VLLMQNMFLSISDYTTGDFIYIQGSDFKHLVFYHQSLPTHNLTLWSLRGNRVHRGRKELLDSNESRTLVDRHQMTNYLP
jgi:glutamate mutase epsilon subunit